MRAILRALEKGSIPWRKPWHSDPNRGGPTRLCGSAYQAMDYLTLQLTAEEKGYQGRWWATGKQWKLLGGTIQGEETP